MTKNIIAIHEVGHAVAFLVHGRGIDAVVIRDNRTALTIPCRGASELPALSDAIITLAGAMAEEVALERGLIPQTLSSLSASTSRRVPPEGIDDDENKYRAAIHALQKVRSGSSFEVIDKNVRRETRALIEQHWKAIIAIADALDSRPWIEDIFPTGRKTKTLDGEEVGRILESL